MSDVTFEEEVEIKLPYNEVLMDLYEQKIQI